MKDLLSKGISRERGFTMIELLIAMAILSVGLVSIVAISAYVSRTNSISSTLSVLATAAQSQVDTLRGAVWTTTFEDTRLAVGGSLTSDVANHNATKTGTPAGDLKVRWQVRQGATADLRYLTIKVVQTQITPGMADGITVTTILYRE